MAFESYFADVIITNYVDIDNHYETINGINSWTEDFKDLDMAVNWCIHTALRYKSCESYVLVSIGVIDTEDGFAGTVCEFTSDRCGIWVSGDKLSTLKSDRPLRLFKWAVSFADYRIY